jgi:Binding-prot-dependent transport system membrane comp, N-term
VLVAVLVTTIGVALVAAQRPEGTLTVAVATFGNERWVPHLYVGAVHSIVGVSARVGDWRLIHGHLSLHNWEYVTHGR